MVFRPVDHQGLLDAEAEAVSVWPQRGWLRFGPALHAGAVHLVFLAALLASLLAAWRQLAQAGERRLAPAVWSLLLLAVA